MAEAHFLKRIAMMHRSTVSKAGPALYSSARQLALQGQTVACCHPYHPGKSHHRLPLEVGKVCFSRIRSSQDLQWFEKQMKRQLQVKWFCTKSQQHIQDELSGMTLKNARDSHRPVSYTCETEDSHMVKEASLTSELGPRKSEIEPTTISEEEVDFEELVKLEVELCRQEGHRVPVVITPFQWQELLTKSSVRARKKYLSFLFVNEKKKENDKKKREIKRLMREEKEREREKVEDAQDQHIQYGLWRNCIFPKILDSTMNHFYHTRVISAIMYGQPLLVDLSFDEHMTPKERQNCAYQLQLLIGLNRIHDDPYNLQLCNAGKSSDTLRRLERYIPTLSEPEFPLIVRPENYLSLFPRNQLVYLTPHCREEMTQYDHNAVYIIGGIVDKSSGNPLTLAKAKKEGIRMQKLPLDKYLSWGIGGKCLTLNQIFNIMLDIKHTGDWHHSLRHVPRRKLRSSPTEEELRAMLIKKRSKERKPRNFHPNRYS